MHACSGEVKKNKFSEEKAAKVAKMKAEIEAAKRSIKIKFHYS